MKTIVLAALSLFISTQALAFNNILECGGRNAEGQTVHYVVNWNTNEITLSANQVEAGIRPFFLQKLQTWAIEKSEIKNSHITVYGYTRMMTTGTVGRIAVTVRKSNTSIYQGTVTVKAPSALVRPVPLVTTPVTCRFR